jgi:uncharacterized protein YaiL (DUF2058 family)
MFANFLSLAQFFKSKTVWATAATLAFNALQGTYHIVPADTASQINMGLAGVIAVARASNTQGK